MGAYARDTQKQRVYDWERAYVPSDLWHERIGLAEAEALVRQVADHYGMKCPAVVVRGLGRHIAGQYWSSERTIKLSPSDGLNRAVVLHELAHAVHHHKCGWNYPGGHGPEFMLVYLDVLEQFGNLSPGQSALLQKTLTRVKLTRVHVAPAHGNFCPGCHPANYVDPNPPALPVPTPKKACGVGRCLGCNYGWVRPDIQFCTYKCAAKWLLNARNAPVFCFHAPGTKLWNKAVVAYLLADEEYLTRTSGA